MHGETLLFNFFLPCFRYCLLLQRRLGKNFLSVNFVTVKSGWGLNECYVTVKTDILCFKFRDAKIVDTA
jgi:hypothetical protein